MKAGLPLYEGDSLLHYAPGEPAAEDNAAREIVEKSVAKLTLVKPATEPRLEAHEAVAEADLDLPTLERRARIVRAEYLHQLAHEFVARIRDAWNRMQQSEAEAYLSQSKSLEELEDRLRRLEREGRLLHI